MNKAREDFTNIFLENKLKDIIKMTGLTYGQITYRAKKYKLKKKAGRPVEIK